VVDLAQEGFPLVGGRVDVIGRTPVPTLVYRRRQHLISLMALPGNQSLRDMPAERTMAGYHIVTWTQDGVTYWAVSDVAMPDLESFAKAFRAAPA
jgi:anti-sigma factor RsiW